MARERQVGEPVSALEVVETVRKIEVSIWRLRNSKGVKHSKWMVLALRGLEAHAKGIRLAVESVIRMRDDT